MRTKQANVGERTTQMIRFFFLKKEIINSYPTELFLIFITETFFSTLDE